MFRVGALRVASTGIAWKQSTKAQRLSPRYVRRWKDILQVDNRRV